MSRETVVIVGAGPCGIAAAIELKRRGIDAVIIEKQNIVDAIYQYPVHQVFFSSSERLEVGNIPFTSINRKPTRQEALVYYKRVVEQEDLRIHSYETVDSIEKTSSGFLVSSCTMTGIQKQYTPDYVIIATGYYGQPNKLEIEGGSLPHVSHYFKEAHPYFHRSVAVIGGKNSAVDAALALEKAGAFVTVLYRGASFSEHVKPWILPDFDSLVRQGKIHLLSEADVTAISEEAVEYTQYGQKQSVPADFVFAMTGYHPDHTFLERAGVLNGEAGRPHFNKETMETNVSGLYVAGVIAAGDNANEIFIENGRWHGEQIASHIKEKESWPSSL